jgi:glycosyltransferase involved in cell wall biosynthesis
MNNKQPYLSIIIPCYNEEENLKRGVIDEVADYLKQKDFEYEVIISDDGSSDNSCKIVKQAVKDKPKFRLLENKHGGKPWAVWKGIENANGEWILFTDMDQSTPIKELDKLLPWTEKGYQAVIGSRGGEREDYPFYRQFGAVVFLTLRKLFLLPKIDDTQCGFKLFKRETIIDIFPKLDVLQTKATGWTVTSYDVELLYMLKHLDVEIKEVPVEWKDRDVSQTKGNYISRYFKESKQMAQQILGVKLNAWRGKYEK